MEDIKEEAPLTISASDMILGSSPNLIANFAKLRGKWAREGGFDHRQVEGRVVSVMMQLVSTLHEL